MNSINQVAKISGNRLVPSKEGDEINPSIIDLSEDVGNLIEKRSNGLYVGSDLNKASKEDVSILEKNILDILYSGLNTKEDITSVDSKIENSIRTNIVENGDYRNNYFGYFTNISLLESSEKTPKNGDYAIVEVNGEPRVYNYLFSWVNLDESEYELNKKMGKYTGNKSDWSIGLLGAFNFKDVYVGTQKKEGLRLWIGEATTLSDANISVYPTTTGNTNGTELFSEILFAIGVVWNPDSSTVNSTHLLGANEISTDLKTISFYNVKGGISIVGGAGLQSGDSGKTVKVMVIGIPK